MKKYLILLALPLFLLPHLASAAAQLCPGGTDGECMDVGGKTFECDTSQQPYTCVAANTGSGKGTVGTGGVCSTDGDCSGNLACINKICQIDPSLEDTGTVTQGSQCDPAKNNTDCPGDQTCSADATGKFYCQGATATGANSAQTSGGFVPLAGIPGLTQNVSANDSGLAGFLQNLYKYLIGLSAILAIIQIIRGGLEYATQDNVSKKGEGRKHIEQALLGLVLVLAPALVFTIINPSILNLSVDLPALTTPAGTATAPGSGGATGGQDVNKTFACQGSNCDTAAASCNTLTGGDQSTGSFSHVCVAADGSTDASIPQNCKVGLSNVDDTCATDCKQGETWSLVCTGSAPINGGGRGGLTDQQIQDGASMTFDGGYMDLVKFTGKSIASISAYKCQATSQTFEKTFTNSNGSAQYVECLTPKVTYVETIGNYLGSTDRTTRDSYDGECRALTSAQQGEGFGGVTLLQDQGVGGDAKAITCTKEIMDEYAGSPLPLCYQAYSTCTDPHS